MQVRAGTNKARACDQAVKKKGGLRILETGESTEVGEGRRMEEEKDDPDPCGFK